MNGWVRLTFEALGTSLDEGPFTSIGAYPKVWLASRPSKEEYLLCCACATQAALTDIGTEWHCGIHWEGEPLECNNCGNEIESAYGEPEETKVSPTAKLLLD